MANIKLGVGWDIHLGEDGRFPRTTRAEKVAQTIKAKIITLQGEYDRDTSIGIPWLSGLLGSTDPDLSAIEAYITRAIISTDDVLSIESMSVQLNRSTRVCDISVTINTSFGETLTLNEVMGA